MNIKEGDQLCGRNNESKGGEVIRKTVGSQSNHNATVVMHSEHGLGIGDMNPPCGEWVPFSHYERIMNEDGYEVRILRIKDATTTERHDMSLAWESNIEGVPYSNNGVKRLWVYKFVTALRYTIKGMWCTRANGIVCRAVFPEGRNYFRKIREEGMPLKKNETPRTVENRLVQGLLEDITDRCIMDI